MNKKRKRGNVLYIVIISILIVAIGVVSWFIFRNDDKPMVILIGNEVETIYLNEKYIERGYNAVYDNGIKYEGEVSIISNLNINQIGVYEIIYRIVEDGDTISETKRIVNVVANPASNITLTLNGEIVEYVLKDNLYQEKGAVAYQNDINITDKIIKEGVVDSSKTGEYNIIYKVNVDGIEKKITRTVKVIDIDVIHSIDTKNKAINLNVYSTEFSYILLPDNKTTTKTSVQYLIDKNGEYKFTIYAKGNLFKEYVVKVSNIEDEKPIGYCQAIVDGDSTEFKIVNGSDNISKYQYNGVDFYTTNYKINDEISKPIIRIYSTNGNYSDITCTIKRIFNNNMNDIPLSTNLTPCNNNWEYYNNELSKLMIESGKKTRTAVAVAADYLARFDYKVAYSWGGKSLSYGINPKWGCEDTVTKDVCSKSTGNMKCIYGMDCTGYTAWAFYQAGFSADILRTSSQSTGMWGNFNASKYKYSFSGNQNLINQIKPGDLVWTEGHVGIVLGTSTTLLKVANMREGIRISYINTKNGKSVNNDKDFTHFVLFDEFFNMYGSNE